jgi:MFS superfamily sulfate permease-like transporter
MSFRVFLDVIPDAIVISIVAFATSISIADLYSRLKIWKWNFFDWSLFFFNLFFKNPKNRKHKYKIDTNKELFALGMSNLVGSFFKCFTAGGTLARSVVQEESGGKTQVGQI